MASANKAYVKKPVPTNDERWEETTNRVIALMEQGGLPPWVKTWDGGATAPVNFATGNRYRGENFLRLSMTPHASPNFMTFKQIEAMAKKMEAEGVPKDKLPHLAKGSHGYSVSKWNPTEKKEEASSTKGSDGANKENDKERAGGFWKYYTVFNEEQIVNFPKQELTQKAPFAPLERGEEFIEAWRVVGGVETNIGGPRAFYVPSQDYIQMPPKASFTAPEHFYSVWAHEAGHSSGHTSRENRDQTGAFGSAKYGREEGVADFSSRLIASEMGIPLTDFDIQQTATYCAGWIKGFKEDPKMLRDIVTMSYAAAGRVVEAHQKYTLMQAREASVEQTAVQAAPEAAAVVAASASASRAPEGKPAVAQTVAEDAKGPAPKADLEGAPNGRYSGAVVSLSDTHMVQQWGEKTVRHQLDKLNLKAPLAEGQKLSVSYSANPSLKASVKELSAKRERQATLAP